MVNVVSSSKEKVYILEGFLANRCNVGGTCPTRMKSATVVRVFGLRGRLTARIDIAIMKRLENQRAIKS